ncbi:hypothetical protein [Dysgonomonas termitidis]|uniref:Uncharacterized protein n=1 Tax=Dysgonomonas termitidis TaxID=1516126 RepID=A0ABV9L3I1_9BACT
MHISLIHRVQERLRQWLAFVFRHRILLSLRRFTHLLSDTLINSRDDLILRGGVCVANCFIHCLVIVSAVLPLVKAAARRLPCFYNNPLSIKSIGQRVNKESLII